MPNAPSILPLNKGTPLFVNLKTNSSGLIPVDGVFETEVTFPGEINARQIYLKKYAMRFSTAGANIAPVYPVMYMKARTGGAEATSGGIVVGRGETDGTTIIDSQHAPIYIFTDQQEQNHRESDPSLLFDLHSPGKTNKIYFSFRMPADYQATLTAASATVALEHIQLWLVITE